ncbi:MAG: TlpA disulfide reductase family protein, partial [Treponema sp.]|nr:TlpA disulfide reductase family protein [Treponema sp.]
STAFAATQLFLNLSFFPPLRILSHLNFFKQWVMSIFCKFFVVNSYKIFLSLLMVIAFSSITIFAQSKTKIEFSAKDINNKNITSEIFEDAELTMINIWGTFCGPCIKEMPDLAQLNKNNENKGFQIIGIVIDAVNRKGLPDSKQMDAAKKIVKQTGADYIHIVPDSKLLNGILQNVFAVPTTIFVDKNGNQVGETYTGSRSLADWQKIVDSLIK